MFALFNINKQRQSNKKTVTKSFDYKTNTTKQIQLFLCTKLHFINSFVEKINKNKQKHRSLFIKPSKTKSIVYSKPTLSPSVLFLVLCQKDDRNIKILPSQNFNRIFFLVFIKYSSNIYRILIFPYNILLL